MRMRVKQMAAGSAERTLISPAVVAGQSHRAQHTQIFCARVLQSKRAYV